MRFFRQLLTANKKIGLVFAQRQSLILQSRSFADGHLYWERSVPYADIELHKKNLHTDISKISCWVLIIPAYQCNTKYAILPSVDSAEIKQMLEYELPNILSYNSLAFVWDFSIIDRRQNGSSKILIVLSPATIIERYVKILSALGIKPDNIIHSGMFHALLLSKQETLTQSDSAGCFCLNDSCLDFFAIEDGKVTFLRGIGPRKPSCEKPGVIEEETRRFFSMLKGYKSSDSLHRFFAINTEGRDDDLTKTIETSLDISIKKIKPADLYINISAVDTEKIQINLLPQYLKEKQLRGSRARRRLWHSLKISLVLFLILLCLKVSIWRNNLLLESYRQRLSDISPVAEKLQFLQQQLSIIENQLQGNTSAIEIIFELFKTLPKDITIHYLSIERNKKVRIRAQAKLLSQSFDCIGPLEESDFFENVMQSYANQRQIEDSVLIDFEIVADIQKRRGGDAK